MSNTTISFNRNNTKKARVMDFLATGKSLTAAQARSRFGVSNFRATISDIKHTVEKYGNWRIVTSENTKGATTYSMMRVMLVSPSTCGTSTPETCNA